MSEEATEAPKVIPKFLVKKLSPSFFLSRDKKITVLPRKPSDLVTKCLKLQASPYKEQVIYSTINNDEKAGDFRSLVLRNQLHTVTAHSRTVASFVTHDKKLLEKTSDKVTELIGKKNYDDVFIALCSVISQELKVKAMLALLTVEQKEKPAEESKTFTERACQTDEISKEIFYDKKKRTKRRVISDVKRTNSTQQLKTALIKKTSAKTPLKWHVVDPQMVAQKKLETKKAIKMEVDNSQSLPEIPNLQLDEDSNCSVISTSQMSVCSEILSTEVKKLISATESSIKTETEEDAANLTHQPEKSENVPKLLKTDAEVFGDNYNPTEIVTLDGTAIQVPVKPEDQFHLATSDILKHITTAERKKLLWHQAYIDWKLCLERDDNGNMPLHLAVQHDDVDLIRRQCLVLRARGQSVDIEANGMSALELALKSDASPACTRTLLDCGASPLRSDREQRNALHLAAEARYGHTREILAAMTKRAREIIADYEELQYPGLMEKSDEEVAKHLLLQTSVLYDSEGYTPLILASRVGNAEVVKLLVTATPETVNTEMPNSGNTALYTAVAEACMNAIDSGNKSKVSDNYIKTIETLIEHGADPEIENRTGIKVSDLLQEFNIKSLCLLIAQKVTSRYFDNSASGSKKYESFMLLKGSDGRVTLIPKVKKVEKGPGWVSKQVVNPKLDSKGQGDVKPNQKPTNSLASTFNSQTVVQKRTTIMPKASSFTEPGTKKTVTPRTVNVSDIRLMRGDAQKHVDVNLTSQTTVQTSNCIILKNEKLPLLTAMKFNNSEERCNKTTAFINGGNANFSVRLKSAPLGRKGSTSPGNVSMTELSDTEKCQKRKSRVSSAEKESDCKKMKSPEG